MKEIIISFASRIDIVDMNNIPIRKTIDMMKRSEKMHRKIANFILNADLSLEDFKYLNDDEIKQIIIRQYSMILNYDLFLSSLCLD